MLHKNAPLAARAWSMKLKQQSNTRSMGSSAASPMLMWRYEMAGCGGYAICDRSTTCVMPAVGLD